MSVKTPDHSDQEEANGEEGEDKKAEVTPITVEDMDGDNQVINVGKGMQIATDKKGKIKFAFSLAAKE